jgi:trans-AT polyketide synthase, acyltransferase and oxidoreductase domains
VKFVFLGGSMLLYWVQNRRIVSSRLGRGIEDFSMTMVTEETRPLGWLNATAEVRPWDSEAVAKALARIDLPFYVVRREVDVGFVLGADSDAAPRDDALPFVACAPSCAPESLGDASFRRDHGLKYAYYGGAMANGIASVELVAALAKAGCLGFYGAAGLPLETVTAAVDRLQSELGDLPFGCNLIHSPNEPELEAAVADLYIRRGVRLVEASAFLGLTLPIVRYRMHGIYRDAEGHIITPNRVVAKVSRLEVATKFFAPPPKEMLDQLVAAGDISAEQAEWAGQIPMAQDVTAEADSGGHTDRRPAVALLPTIQALAERMQAEYNYAQRLRVGLGGGISTPASAAAAFAMGAAYVVTGSVNQACVESGSCDVVREWLSKTEQADVCMAPAADMFEMGVEVQVLKRGTMFAMRGAKLYELYRAYARLEDIPVAERAKLEKTIFRAPLDQVWELTKAFFQKRDPKQVERAERDPKHKMALVFRSYLGQASGWANQGDPSRVIDYQVWCGPAMGAFNEWVRGSFLEAPEARTAEVVAKNILQGAAVLSRCATLRPQGVALAVEATRIIPRSVDQLEEQRHG